MGAVASKIRVVSYAIGACLDSALSTTVGWRHMELVLIQLCRWKDQRCIVYGCGAVLFKKWKGGRACLGSGSFCWSLLFKGARILFNQVCFMDMVWIKLCGWKGVRACLGSESFCWSLLFKGLKISNSLQSSLLHGYGIEQTLSMEWLKAVWSWET